MTTRTVWDQMCAVDSYQSWWPWLRGLEAASLQAGETWSCAVQPPVPYALRFTVTMDTVVPQQTVTATIAGDITGSARLDLASSGAGCDVRLVSLLAPGNRVLRAVARVARPMVRFGHDWVLNTGARQFARALPDG